MWSSEDRSGGFTYLGVNKLKVVFKVLGIIESVQREKKTEEQPIANTDFIGYYANTNIYIMF